MDTNQLLAFIANHWILWSLLVAILVALSIEPLLQRLRGIRKISVFESTRLINQENARVIDIREEKDFAKEHILDSLSAPLANLPNRLKALDELKGHPLILVWSAGQQSMRAAGQLRRQGHKHVYVLRGGIESWREAKMPLFSGHAKATPKAKSPSPAEPQPDAGTASDDKAAPEAGTVSETGAAPENGAPPETGTPTAEAGAQSESAPPSTETGTAPEGVKQPETSSPPAEAGPQPEPKAPPGAGAQPEAKQSKPPSRAKSGKKPKSRKKTRPAKKSKAK